MSQVKYQGNRLLNEMAFYVITPGFSAVLRTRVGLNSSKPRTQVPGGSREPFLQKFRGISILSSKMMPTGLYLQYFAKFSLKRHYNEIKQITKGCGSPVVKVSDHGRHAMVSSPVPLKICRVGQRCTLNLSRTQTSSRWCDVIVRRGGASSGVVHVT
ncbi:uncharacterized protein TNCV_1023661 [Trichonephila clavipes]|nr:uncharacterized protein TNCV_1023661 [Trichonephila clavipes]